jgi:diguanylate cyclase (GGDEF)-like protein/PAS domain S-box-containing protein
MMDKNKGKEQLLTELSEIRHRLAELEKSETKRKQEEATLHKLFTDHQIIFDSLPAMIWYKDTQNCVIRVNQAAARAVGRSTDEIEGKSIHELFPDEAEEYFQDDLDVIRTGKPKIGIVEKLQIAGGKKIWVQTDKIPLREEKGNIIGILLFVVDVSDLKQAESMLAESEERYRTAIEYSNDGVALVRGGLHIYVNQKFLKIFGYDATEEVIGKTHAITVHPDDVEMVVERNRKRERGEFVPSRYEFKGIRKDGTPIYLEVSVTQITFHEEATTLAYFRDVTERKGMEEKLKVMSTMDELTGLFNRRGFLSLSQQYLLLAERTRQNYLFLFTDLDNMKSINDTLGHPVGDKALVDTADILKKTFRKTDIIGRVGGDEFAILSIGATDNNSEVLARRLQDNIKTFNTAGRRHYTISLSVGIVRYDPQNPSSLEDLMAQADQLMYEEKRKKCLPSGAW